MAVDRITPEQNVALLEKGRKNLPKSGEIAYLLGFVYYYFMGEREKAAENLDDAAKLRGYAPYAILAARMRAEANNPDLSLVFPFRNHQGPQAENLVQVREPNDPGPEPAQGP